MSIEWNDPSPCNFPFIFPIFFFCHFALHPEGHLKLPPFLPLLNFLTEEICNFQNFFFFSKCNVSLEAPPSFEDALSYLFVSTRAGCFVSPSYSPWCH